MDRSELKKKLGEIEIQDFIVKNLEIAKNEAQVIVKKELDESIKLIEESACDEVKLFLCLLKINEIKKELIDIGYSDFDKVVRESRKYNYSINLKEKTETEEFYKIANYIEDYNNFMKSSNFMFENYLKDILLISLKYYRLNGLLETTKKYFEVINSLNIIKDFYWNWNNFEKGLNLIFKNHVSEIISVKSDAKFQIELSNSKNEREIKQIESNHERQIEKLNNQIEDLNYEIKTLKGKLKYNENYYDKYYKAQPVIFFDTYFGDNLPFVVELYKFFRKENLYKYGFSYFYLCLLVNNEELINLNSDKKMSFLGRIFYRLNDFLIKDYRYNDLKFFHSKFLINFKSIPKDFKTNHMKAKYDKNIDYELIDIDKFFDKLSKIYIKY